MPKFFKKETFTQNKTHHVIRLNKNTTRGNISATLFLVILKHALNKNHKNRYFM